MKLWESTVTGAPATGDGNDLTGDGNIGTVNPSAIGTIFNIDPVTGDLVGLAGNTDSSGTLTADEISRLGFEADGFVVRLNRDGNLRAATPIVSPQKLYHSNVPLDAKRFANYTLRVDPSGNAYVATAGCCDAAGQNSVGYPD